MSRHHPRKLVASSPSVGLAVALRFDEIVTVARSYVAVMKAASVLRRPLADNC